MLTIWGARQQSCDGMSRRNFLKIGAFGAGLSLADMLRLRGIAADAAKGKKVQSKKAAIMIYLPGGPSHMDMYDIKTDAPKEYRGEFSAIDTNVPGVQICEHFPMQAKMWDKLAAVRSIISVEEHSDSLVMTGYSERENRTAGHPSFGSVVSKLRGDMQADMPPFVSLRGMTRGTEPGYLGLAHRPFSPNGQGLRNLRLSNGMTEERMEDRKQLLESFDKIRNDVDATGTMDGLDAYNQRAFDMILSGSVHKALDLRKEDAKTLERYKDGLEPFLTARRLVEAGVGCVTLSFGSWDTHGQNFQTLKRQLPRVDRGVANLIQDLCDRGLDKDVVTIMWGEFGRTPKVNNQAGRDHWAPVMGAMIAGGGLKMGQAVGSTSERGERPKERPCTVPQVLSTIYQTIGIDPAGTFPNDAGRPMHILDDRAVVKELL